MAEKRTTPEQASSPVPRARAAAEPPPAKATKAAKTTKAVKATKATKIAKTATTAKAAKRAKAAEPAKTEPAKTEPAKTANAAKATKATAAKATKAAKPAKRTKAAQATKTTTPKPPSTPAARPSAAPGAWTSAVREALSQADQPPQRLAELAVVELGPRAAAWVSWLHDTYPDPPAHGITRLAAHEARQAGWAVAIAEAGGPVTAALSLPAAAWVRAMLVLRIAAAYGRDPADPQRAADLIDLLDLRPGESRLPVAPGLLTAVRGRRRRLVGFAAARIGVRRAPVVAALRMLIAGGDLGEQLDQLAHRAASYYRHGSQDRRSANAASISSPNRP